MTVTIAHVNVWVHDQDEALDFYTRKLGFEVRADVTLAELGDFRWLAVGPVGQPEVSLVLMAVPGAPVFQEDTREMLVELMGRGALGAIFFTTDDCRETIEQFRERGVDIAEEPSERPYGIDAGIRDPSGNEIRVTQALPVPATS
jgi:catechol 2,3-dioxygenase-like lactoylglutathione lyase family enzyme